MSYGGVGLLSRRFVQKVWNNSKRPLSHNHMMTVSKMMHHLLQS
jgi:hypothetical protein